MSNLFKSYYNKDYYYTDCGNYDCFLRDDKVSNMAWTYRKAVKLSGIQSNSTILDIGCGRGEILRICAANNIRAYGIDYSSDAVEIATNYISKHSTAKNLVTIRNMDCTKLDFPDNFFTHVFMLDIVEHLYPKDLEKTLYEVKRVLKNGGKLIIHTNPNRLYNDYGFKYYTRFINFIINMIFRKNTWTRMSQIRPPIAKILHVNEQTYFSLKKNLKPIFSTYKIWLQFSCENLSPIRWPLEMIRHFYPLSLFFPFNQFFCNWIWAIAQK